MAETGLPGSPKTSAPCWATPNQVGLPGFSATRQKTRSTPSEANASLTWSWPPTETPPQTTTSSASSIRSIAARVSSGSSLTVSVATSSAPALRASAGIV